MHFAKFVKTHLAVLQNCLALLTAELVIRCAFAELVSVPFWAPRSLPCS